MAKRFENSEDPDQTQHSAAFDLGLHFANYPITIQGVSRLKWVKNTIMLITNTANGQ